MAPSVVQRLGVRVHGDAAALLGLALRRNPKRAQLLVSRVLGKHVPTDPRLVRGAGLLLGARVAAALGAGGAGPAGTGAGDAALRAALDDPAAVADLHATALAGVLPAPADALVLGFAETATALGHCVAEALGGADLLHSTRRPVPGFATAGGFAEEHSHAVDHLLLPRDPALLRGGRPLVLVDDELSTGRTALNTIAALHRAAPRERYVVAALVDVRGPDPVLVEGVAALGARLDVVALARGRVELPADLADRAAALRAEVEREGAAPAGGAGPATATGEPAAPHAPRAGAPAPARRAGPAAPGPTRVELPGDLPVGGRHGFTAADHAALAAALPGLAAALGAEPGERTLVLGTEELMALPLRLAETLALGGHDVRSSTTTRSPAVVVDEPGYALRSGIAFPAHDDPADGPGPRYAYNLGGPGSWDHVVVVVDPPGDTPALHDGLLTALAPLTRRTTLVVTGP